MLGVAGWRLGLSSLLVGVSAELLLSSGMEIVLTVPLALALLALLLLRRTPWSLGTYALAGLLGAITILSRLDSVLLLALLAGADTLLGEQRLLRHGLRPVLALAAGLLPVPLYLLSNRLWFHTWMPVSGMAKELRTHHGISQVALHSIGKAGMYPLLTIAITVAGILALPGVWREFDRWQRSIVAALLLFPFAHFTIIAISSDWALWPWYFYPWLLSSTVAIPVLWRAAAAAPGRFGILIAAPTAMVLALFALYGIKLIGVISRHHGQQIATRVEAGERIAEFAADHPGRFAMGDRSGVVSEMIPDPIIQTEGLVMDEAYLHHLRKQEDLLSVLRAYEVHYYIASVRNGTPYQPCLKAVEPAQAGPSAPHMRSTLCAKPLLVSSNADYTTLIYDLTTIPR